MYPVIIVADRIAKVLFGVDITRSWTEAEEGEWTPSTRGELQREMGEAFRASASPKTAERR